MDLATTIYNFSVKSGVIGLVILFTGWLIVILLNGFKKGPFDLSQAGPATRAGFGITMLGIVVVVIAVLSAMASAVIWMWHLLSNLLTPGSLALYSAAIGFTPLIFSALGVILAKFSGGTVDARGAQNCSIKGVDLGGIVYALFMSYWLMIFTIGLMVAGLLVSGIWAALY